MPLFGLWQSIPSLADNTPALQRLIRNRVAQQISDEYRQALINSAFTFGGLKLRQCSSLDPCSSPAVQHCVIISSNFPSKIVEMEEMELHLSLILNARAAICHASPHITMTHIIQFRCMLTGTWTHWFQLQMARGQRRAHYNLDSPSLAAVAHMQKIATKITNKTDFMMSLQRYSFVAKSFRAEIFLLEFHLDSDERMKMKMNGTRCPRLNRVLIRARSRTYWFTLSTGVDSIEIANPKRSTESSM